MEGDQALLVFESTGHRFPCDLANGVCYWSPVQDIQNELEKPIFHHVSSGSSVALVLSHTQLQGPLSYSYLRPLLAHGDTCILDSDMPCHGGNTCNTL